MWLLTRVVEVQVSNRQELITQFAQELISYLRNRPGVDLEAISHSTPEMSFDLGKARKNQIIHNRAGDRIFVTNVTGVAYIRYNSPTASKYRLRLGPYSTPFQKLYLENEAQADKNVSIIIGYGAFVDFASAYLNMKLLKADDTEVNPASEEKQDSILAQLDNKISTLANQDTLALIKAKTNNLDVGLSTRASQDTLAAVLARLQGNTGSHDVVSVGTDATEIRPANASRKELLIYNNGSVELYIGSSNGVTVANAGVILVPHQGALEKIYKGAFWGIVSAGSVNTRYWETT